MLKRMIYFGIGLAIGIVFLVFFFRGKGTEFCYLPNCRVLKDIRNKQIKVDENLKLTYNFKGKDRQILKELLVHGTIDFSESDTESTSCKTYIITNKQRTFTIENCAKGAIIRAVVEE
jgi:hypothetical protein